MGMKAPNTKQFSLPDEGIVPARLARAVEIGEHKTGFGVKDQVFLFFSLPTRIIDDEDDDYHGKQHMVRTQPLRNSTSEKAGLWDFRKVLNPKTTDYRELINLPCFLTLKHNAVESDGTTRTYCNIIGQSGVPEGMTVGELDTVPFYYDYDDPDPEIWAKLGDWMQSKIKSSLNFHGSATEAMVLHLDAMSSED